MLTYKDAHEILLDYQYNTPLHPKVRKSINLVLKLTRKQKVKRFLKRERQRTRNA